MEEYMSPITCIGTGGFGTVYKGIRHSDGKSVVVKKAFDAFNEIVTLYRLNHVDGVIKLDDFFISKNYYYMVFDYDPKLVDLDQYLSSHLLSEQTAQRLLVELVHIIKKCLLADIYHNDLKPQNILTDGERVILIDFGLATSTSEKYIVPGTLLYAPPEYLDFDLYEPSCGTVWAIGLILYCMLHAGVLPFETRKDIISDHPIVILNRQHLSAECVNFLEQCLEKDPTERMTFEDMYNHPFIWQA